MLDASSLPHEPKFIYMSNIIHIDEKWFYMTKKSKSYYLLPEEEDPLRTCQSKNFIGKVMFLVALARPRFDDEGKEIFSGKIGVFPLVTKQPALRRSRNRDAGTLETKPITSVTKEVIRAFLLEKVIPVIKNVWPVEELGQIIFIQQDNARTHIRPDDEQFNLVASQTRFDIKLMCQPPNSPDLNVLDLGFFRSIQSLQDKECTTNVDELIKVVEKSFEEYPTSKINQVFLSLQLCMKEIMRVEGSNRYKIQHINKNGLERNGNLPKQISCEYDLVQKTNEILLGRR